jgi:hypothetical protein
MISSTDVSVDGAGGSVTPAFRPRLMIWSTDISSNPGLKVLRSWPPPALIVWMAPAPENADSSPNVYSKGAAIWASSFVSSSQRSRSRRPGSGRTTS